MSGSMLNGSAEEDSNGTLDFRLFIVSNYYGSKDNQYRGGNVINWDGSKNLNDRTVSLVQP
jgi:hypothetical protein